MFCGRKPIPLFNLLLLLNTAVAQYINEGCLIREFFDRNEEIPINSNNIVDLWISRKGNKTEIEIEAKDANDRSVYQKLTLPDTFPEALHQVKLDFENSTKLQFNDESGEVLAYEFIPKGHSPQHSKKLFVKNTFLTEKCSQGLPFIQLGSGKKDTSFPIISSKRTMFVIISVGEMSVPFSFKVNDGEIFMCWDSVKQKITGQKDSSGCQKLPSFSPNLFALEHINESRKIKINDEEVQGNYTFDGKVQFSLRNTEHPVYVIQCLIECPPSSSEKQSTPGDNQSSQTDDDQSSQTDDDQSSQTCHDHTTQSDKSNVTSLVLGLLFGTSTIIIAVLSCKIWHFKTYRSTNGDAYPSDAEEDATGRRASVVMSQTPTEVSSGQSPSQPRQEHHYNECVETINDIYEPFENYAIREEP